MKGFQHEMHSTKHLLLEKYRDVRTFSVRVLENQYTIQILISVRN